MISLIVISFKLVSLMLSRISLRFRCMFIIIMGDFQENPAVLQATLSGDTNTTTYQQGNRDRALALLHQIIEDAHMGKRQFLSGKIFKLID